MFVEATTRIYFAHRLASTSGKSIMVCLAIIENELEMNAFTRGRCLSSAIKNRQAQITPIGMRDGLRLLVISASLNKHKFKVPKLNDMKTRQIKANSANMAT